MKTDKRISKISLLFLCIALGFMLISAFMVFIQSDLIPHLLNFVASILICMMFYAIYIAKWKGFLGNSIFALALINSAILIGFQHLGESTKALYPLLTWVFSLVIILSLQRYLQLNSKPFFSAMRWVNYLFLIALLPLLLLKFANPSFWQLFGVFAGIVLSANGILAVLKSSTN